MACFFAITVQAWAAGGASLPAGKAVSVSGKVLIRKDGEAESTARKLRPGDIVHVGEVINTSSDGKTKIMLEDKTIIDLGSSALFKVGKFKPGTPAAGGGDREVELDMMYGTLRSSVTKKVQGKGKFNIRTPSATMGVRGTEFVVQTQVSSPSQVSGIGSAKAADAKTEITVLQGNVAVAPPVGSPGAASMPSVSLSAGQQLVTLDAGSFANAKPVTLNSDQLSQVATSAKVQDNTFQQAIVIDSGMGERNSAAEGKDSGSTQSGGEKKGETAKKEEKKEGGEGPRSPASSAAGSTNMTAQLIANSVSETAIAPPKFNTGDAGFIGMFRPGDALGPPPVNITAGGLRRVEVIIVR